MCPFTTLKKSYAAILEKQCFKDRAKNVTERDTTPLQPEQMTGTQLEPP